MNKNTKIIIGVGIAALLFMFRKQIFGGGNGEGTEETFVPDTSGPSETVEAPKETGADTTFKPFVPPPPIKPSLVNVNPTAATTNTVVPRVDSPVFFSAPSPFALGGK